MIILRDLLFNEEYGDIKNFQEITIFTFTFTEGTKNAIIKINELNPDMKVNLVLNSSQQSEFSKFLDDDVDFKSKIKGIFLSNELNNHSKLIILNSTSTIKVYVGSFNFNNHLFYSFLSRGVKRLLVTFKELFICRDLLIKLN